MDLLSDLSALPDGFPARVSCVRLLPSRDVTIHHECLDHPDAWTWIRSRIPTDSSPDILPPPQTQDSQQD